MAKKTLEEKIKLVCWRALGLTILYFLIGAWLISDGPKFDPTKTYNLLKDTLTLTAAFLAPVAAFVLFSDWREQHIEKLLEQESSEIYASYIDILDTWQHYRFEVEDDEVFTQSTIESREAKHFGLMDRVEKAIQITEQLQSRDIKAKEFTELALNCFKEIRNLIFELNILGSFKEKQFNPQKYNFEYTDESNSEFSSRMELNFEGMQEQMMTNFSRVYGNKSKLFAFSSNLKIQN
ncbi:hypothetical protein H0S57_05880 [Acinetobacter johnsonii]|uniref:hypothetical protein n=1 Tax=Acinetobacter johnsonii TaxID=40214 RepID=UPI0018A0F1D1|nr:hypothetical protein [Acinetobacter johnsonii]QPF36126.1 hypothetical protein H0S57_05880 [Acinetobacter johnsonii]